MVKLCRRRESGLLIATAITAMFGGAATVQAWHAQGHHHSVAAAVQNLPEDVPEFFRQGTAVIGHCSIDPDLFRLRATPQLRNANGPEHYIDLEYLGGAELPETRYAFLATLHEQQLDPQQVGLLPYAIAEHAQRLTIAFAEHRRDPDNPHVRTKCLVYAGLLAHYAADLCMPLHTTVHHDGRVQRGDDGRWTASPRTGLHAKVDALPSKLPYKTLFTRPLVMPPAMDEPWMIFIGKELAASHALVNKVYDLEPQIPGEDEAELTDPEVIAFTIERTRASAAFTAAVFLKAWRDSAAVELPDWLDRPALEGE